MHDTRPASPPHDTETASLKIPPHSIEAEQSVLGSVFLDAGAWDKVAPLVLEEDFYRADHRLIFRAISQLGNVGQPYDIVTVAEWLEDNQLLDEAGGMGRLATLAEETPTAANITAYANIVRKRSILRQLLRATTDISDAVYHTRGLSSEEILAFAEETVFGIAERSQRGAQSGQAIKTYLAAALERVDELYHSDSPITGLATGWSDLDRMTAGLQRSDLIIVAGRPSMGKTTLAINIAEHAVIKGQQAVAVYSMEMPGEQLAMRMMASLGRIDQHKVRTGRLDDEDWPRLTSAVGLLTDTRLYIDDTPALAPADLRARCRRIKREHGLDMVVIDYLQLMQVPGTTDNRATEISEISRSLKAMARELDVPVIALSQLNRSLEQRTDKRPVMSDLRESGAIEQDADVILFIYRDEVYDEDSPDKGIAEVIIGKQRNGPIGRVKLAFRGQYTRFEDYIDDALLPPSGGYALPPGEGYA